MAKQRPTEPAAAAKEPAPEVSHERSDIDPAGVFWSGVAYAILVVSATALSYWLSAGLLRLPAPARDPGLPPTRAAAPERSSSPQLEAIEDLQQKRWPRLLPRRAADYLAPQEHLLEKGGAGTIPIEQAMANLKAEVRKNPTPSPRTFATSLPSKAAAGRIPTGGDR